MTPNKNSISKVNKLQGAYLAANLNEVWTLDITNVNLKYYWFLIIDLASRRIVYYEVSERDYTSLEVIHLLQMAINLEESVYPQKRVRIVHTDSGGIFVSNAWKKCLIDNNLETSSSDSKNHQNQVSERLNCTFKSLLRKKLNKDLKKENNKTSTLQLIREATKYNFQNLKTVTKELIDYYNAEKPHAHLRGLTPDAWASEARLLPNKTHILTRKEPTDLDVVNPVVEVLENKEDILEHIEVLNLHSKKFGLGLEMSNKNPKEILEKMLELNKTFSIVPIPGMTKNNNSDTAKIIREHKNNIGFLKIRSDVENKEIDLSLMSPEIQTLYGEMVSDHDKWKEVELESLRTILLQNELLLSNVEDLKRDLRERTEFLESQNKELLDMNRYLVDQAKEAEEEKKLILERRFKRQNAKRRPKRDYISPDEFYELVDEIVYKCEDSRYIVSRQRVAFFIMYFTGLRVSNLLVLTRRHVHELINNLFTEIPLIKGGRPNHLLVIADAKDLLRTHFIDDIAVLLKDKEDDDFVFTSENNRFSPLHRVSFTKDLNRTLKYASEQYHKKITCHSFRVTFITDGLEQGVPLHMMQKAVGHESIKSTEFYIRFRMSVENWTHTVKLINRDKINAFNIRIEENIARKAKKKDKTISLLVSDQDKTF
jgi:site-specific recombinase XerD